MNCVCGGRKRPVTRARGGTAEYVYGVCAIFRNLAMQSMPDDTEEARVLRVLRLNAAGRLIDGRCTNDDTATVTDANVCMVWT